MFLVFAPIAVKIAPANADCPLGINVFLPSLFFLVVAYAIIPIITIAVNVIPVKAKSPGDFIILKNILSPIYEISIFLRNKKYATITELIDIKSTAPAPTSFAILAFG